MEEQITLKLPKDRELAPICDSPEYKKFFVDLPSPSPASHMNEIDVTPERVSLTFKGIAFLCPLSHVKGIFDAELPTKREALLFVGANLGLGKAIQYFYDHRQALNKPQSQLDESPNEIKDLERRTQKLDALFVHIYPDFEDFFTSKTVSHKEGSAGHTENAADDGK